MQLCRGDEVVLEIEGGTPADGQKAVALARRADLPFRVTTREDRALLWSGPDLLAEVSQAQAARWNTTPYTLARTFAARLEAARSGKVPPAPALEPVRLTIPLGESRSARWRNVAGPPALSISDPSVAQPTVVGSEVRVQGTSPGKAEVTLSWPQATLTLPVEVRPVAARLPAELEVAVAGGMPFEEALRRVLLGRAAPHPAARLEVSFLKPPAAGPAVPVQVVATGPGLLKAQQKIQVRFVPTRVEVTRAGALVMSNRPEKVRDTGILLRQPLPAAPVRLLVHHASPPGGPERFLEIRLRNPCSSPLRIFSVLAAVGPSQDEIFAGHQATRLFLQRLQDGQGVTLRVAPGEDLLVERLRMKPGQTVSAMGWLEPVQVAGLELVVQAVDGQGQSSGADLADPGPGPFPTGRGLFPPEMQAAYAHDLGSRYTFIPLGDAPFAADPDTGEPDPGNFGVVNRLRIVLRNPTGEAREARLDFHPRGGPARGLFFVDGTFLETPMASHGNPFRLGRWTLAPGEVREVYLETMPQSGSNYPVNLEVQSDFLNLPSGPPPEWVPLEPRWLL